MTQSTFLKYLRLQSDKSLLIKFVLKTCSSLSSLFYASIFLAGLNKAFLFIVKYVKRLKHYSFVAAFISKLDIKFYALFFFVIGQILFPGYGGQDSGVAFLPGSPAASIGNRLGSFSNLIIFIFLLSLLIIVFFKDLVKKPGLFSISFFELVLLLFLISLEVSMVFSTYPAISFVWFIKVCRGILIYFIFSRLIISKKYLSVIGLSFLSIVCIQSLLAIAQFLHNGLLGLPIETAGSIVDTQRFYLGVNSGSAFRPMGTLSQANVLSFFLAFSAPFALLFLYDKNKFIRLFSLISIFLFGVGSIITFSRWGLTTLFFSIGVFFFLSYFIRAGKFNMRSLVLIIFFIFVTLFVFIRQSNFITRFLYFSFSDTSFTRRLNLVIQAFYVFIHNPWFGIGGGAFPKYIINYDYSPQNISLVFPAPVHNLLLLLLSEVGIVPFILFLVMVFYFAISFFRTAHKLSTLKDHFYLLFSIALFVSCLTYLFNGLWEIRSLDEHFIVLFWMNIGLYFNIARLKKFS